MLTTINCTAQNENIIDWLSQWQRFIVSHCFMLHVYYGGGFVKSLPLQRKILQTNLDHVNKVRLSLRLFMLYSMSKNYAERWRISSNRSFLNMKCVGNALIFNITHSAFPYCVSYDKRQQHLQRSTLLFLFNFCKIWSLLNNHHYDPHHLKVRSAPLLDMRQYVFSLTGTEGKSIEGKGFASLVENTVVLSE